MYLFTYRWMR